MNKKGELSLNAPVCDKILKEILNFRIIAGTVKMISHGISSRAKVHLVRGAQLSLFGRKFQTLAFRIIDLMQWINLFTINFLACNAIK